MYTISFNKFKNNLKKIMDASSDQHEAIIIKRSDGENMILLTQKDYESLHETTYLLGTETNAKHLRQSIKSLRKKI